LSGGVEFQNGFLFNQVVINRWNLSEELLGMFLLFPFSSPIQKVGTGYSIPQNN
jgi:hypothetical protein